MIKTLALLFFEFMKIGLFNVGGGLSAVPFLYDMARKYTWFKASDIADMIAISESTPGPIGINMATYAGYNACSFTGAVVATMGIVVPNVIIALAVSSVIAKNRDNRFIVSAFDGIRPAVCALVSAACIDILKISVFRWDNFRTLHDLSVLINWKAAIFFAVTLYLIRKFHKHPVLYILLGAVMGLVVKF